MSALSIGPFCEKRNRWRGFAAAHLGAITKAEQSIANSIMYELGEFRIEYGIQWKFVEQWIAVLRESFLPDVSQANLEA